MCVCVRACTCVYVCVCARESERVRACVYGAEPAAVNSQSAFRTHLIGQPGVSETNRRVKMIS